MLLVMLHQLPLLLSTIYSEVMLALVMRPTSCSKAVVLMLLCASHGDTAAAATMPAGEWLWQED